MCARGWDLLCGLVSVSATMVALNYDERERVGGLVVVKVKEEDWLKERRRSSWVKMVMAKLLAR